MEKLALDRYISTISLHEDLPVKLPGFMKTEVIDAASCKWDGHYMNVNSSLELKAIRAFTK